jgi:hypothetical protein
MSGLLDTHEQRPHPKQLLNFGLAKDYYLANIISLMSKINIGLSSKTQTSLCKNKW